MRIRTGPLVGEQTGNEFAELRKLTSPVVSQTVGLDLWVGSGPVVLTLVPSDFPDNSYRALSRHWPWFNAFQWAALRPQ